MPELWGKTYSRSELIRHTGDLRQLASVQPFVLEDGRERGVRCVAVRSAAGLEFTVILDRGMGIYDLRFQGAPVAFMTAAGVVHPSYAEPQGMGFLKTWPAGFLTSAGLTQVGSPCTDGDEELGLHGRLSYLTAWNSHWGAEWEGERYRLWVEGLLRETTVFGENIVLHRRIWTYLDEPRFWIDDRVENQGQEPAPHMFLQHFNLGFPLVSAAARLELPPHATQPRDEAARQGLEACLAFEEPVDGYEEQVFYHELEPDAAGQVQVRLVNPELNAGQGLGVGFQYAKAEFPYLVEWKMMRAGLYALGIEPANCHVGGRCEERALGTLQFLQPQETRSYRMEIFFFTLKGHPS